MQKLGQEKEKDQRLYHELQTGKDRLYESYALGKMEVDDYRYAAEGIALRMKKAADRMEEVKCAYERAEKSYQSPKQDMKQIIRFLHLEALTQEAVDLFIRKILVYKDRRVEITWDFAEKQMERSTYRH